MKFDMGAAWNEAVRLMSANRQVLLIVAGVFFFLPYVGFVLVFSNEMTALEASQASDPDPRVMMEAMMGLYGQFWWLLAIMMIFQAIGVLGLLALLSDRSRPTVGEALTVGGKLLLPYLGAQLLMSCVYGLMFLVPIAIGVGVSAAAGVLVGAALFAAFLYLFTKFLLVSPVMAIERVINPISAMGRSWRLSKGNSLRLFLFIFLLLVAVVVVSSVASMVLGLIFAMTTPEIAAVGNALVSGIVNAAFYTVFLAVLAAVHRQLAGPEPGPIRKTVS